MGNGSVRGNTRRRGSTPQTIPRSARHGHARSLRSATRAQVSRTVGSRELASRMRSYTAPLRSGGPADKLMRRLIPLHLYHEIGEALGSIEQNLVWNLRRNSDHITSRQCSADPAFDLSVSFLVRLCFFSTHHRSPDQQSGGSRLNEENVRLVFMPLDNPIGFSPREHEQVIGEVRQPLGRDVVSVCACFRLQLALKLRERRSRPQFETLRSSLLRIGQENCKRQ